MRDSWLSPYPRRHLGTLTIANMGLKLFLRRIIISALDATVAKLQTSRIIPHLAHSSAMPTDHG